MSLQAEGQCTSVTAGIGSTQQAHKCHCRLRVTEPIQGHNCHCRRVNPCKCSSGHCRRITPQLEGQPIQVHISTVLYWQPLPSSHFRTGAKILYEKNRGLEPHPSMAYMAICLTQPAHALHYVHSTALMLMLPYGLHQWRIQCGSFQNKISVWQNINKKCKICKPKGFMTLIQK